MSRYLFSVDIAWLGDTKRYEMSWGRSQAIGSVQEHCRQGGWFSEVLGWCIDKR